MRWTTSRGVIELRHVAELFEGLAHVEGTLEQQRNHVPSCPNCRNKDLAVEILIASLLGKRSVDGGVVPHPVG